MTAVADKEEAPPRALRILVAMLLLGLLVELGLVRGLDARLTDFDELWHLAAGRVMIESREVPFRDPFTYTAGSAPWVNSNWAAQVFLAGLYRVGGLELCWVFGIALSLVALALVVISIRGRVRSAWAIPPIIIYVLCVLGTTSEIRPQGWTFALLALSVVLLEWSRRRPWLAAAVLAGLIGLAGQLHGGYVFLPALAALAAIAELWDVGRGATGSTGKRAVALFSAIAAGLILVVMIHPHHGEAVAHPLRYRFDPAFRDLNRLTTELAPPNLKTGPGLLTAMGVLGLLGLGLAGRPALRSEDVCIAVGFTYLALTSLRGLHYFAVAAAVPLALSLDAALDAVARHGPRWMQNQMKMLDHMEPAARDFARFAPWTLAGAGLFCLAWFAPRFAPGEPGDVSSPVLAHHADAADMARFLAAHDPPGNLWNEFELGGVLAWGLYPRRIYIDGRGDLHARAGTFAEYLTIHDAAPGFEDRLKERGCDLVIAYAGGPLAIRLEEQGWHMAHRSPEAVNPLELWVRPGSPADARLLRR